MAEAEEIKRGMKFGILSSETNVSRAKRTPAIGLLKIAAIPPAAPHPRRSFLCFSVVFEIIDIFDPIAAPVTEIGDSSPADPPKINVKKLLISCE